MRLIVRLFLFVILSFCFSCEEYPIFIKCNDCTETEPVQTSLELKFDVNYNQTPIIIKVYEGDLEDSVLFKTYYVYGTSTTISDITINKKYTVTATYYIPDNYYITVDSALPKVKYVKDLCENPCYYVYDRVIDLRLKYH
jgi:hypothetical protein